MGITDIDFFAAAERRLAWVDQRQQLLAQNVANANTPGFIPKDTAPFAATMSGAGLTQTSPMHLPAAEAASAQTVRRSAGRAPDGNAVSVEEQLGKIADTAGVQALVLNLHHTYQTMMRTALGRAS